MSKNHTELNINNRFIPDRWIAQGTLGVGMSSKAILESMVRQHRKRSVNLMYSQTTKCYGISNTFRDESIRLFFNEYDDTHYMAMIEEIKHLQSLFNIDLYLFESSPEHYHLLSFDILNLKELKHVINYCTNDGDYLYNFYDRNFEYVLRLSEKQGTPIKFLGFWQSKYPNKHTASLQHIKAYKVSLGVNIPLPPQKPLLNLDTKIVVYRTNKRPKKEIRS